MLRSCTLALLLTIAGAPSCSDLPDVVAPKPAGTGNGAGAGAAGKAGASGAATGKGGDGDDQRDAG